MVIRGSFAHGIEEENPYRMEGGREYNLNNPWHRKDYNRIMKFKIHSPPEEAEEDVLLKVVRKTNLRERLADLRD